jgi:hypothetical protein
MFYKDEIVLDKKQLFNKNFIEYTVVESSSTICTLKDMDGRLFNTSHENIISLPNAITTTKKIMFNKSKELLEIETILGNLFEIKDKNIQLTIKEELEKKDDK